MTGASRGTERLVGLLDGEELVAMLAVRYSPGMQTDLEEAAPSGMRRPSVVQRQAYALWVRRSAAAGFPIAGPEMILGVSHERLLVWRPALLRSRPRRFAGAITLSKIHSAGVHRKLFASVLTLLLDDGKLVGVETLRTTRLRRFAAAIPSYTGNKAR
ncbi:MAG TPA: hypothetical protein VHP57_08070 [Acidimicrobiia bacterium]|nr:hypothetical protein [Acidimicrobiia bacterium]